LPNIKFYINTSENYFNEYNKYLTCFLTRKTISYSKYTMFLVCELGYVL